MKKLRTNQDGIAHLAIILVILVVAVVGLVGWRVLKNQDNKKLTSTAETQVTQQASEGNQQTQTVDLTAGWKTYNSVDGKFSLKYPQAWVTASNPELCADGIFMLGADKESVGKCASEGIGQMTITWRTDRAFCGDLDSVVWTINSKEKVDVSGVSATKITAEAKAPGEGLGTVPEGTKDTQYCFVKNNTTYIANYTQLSRYPDALADFNTMVIETLVVNWGGSSSATVE